MKLCTVLFLALAACTDGLEVEQLGSPGTQSGSPWGKKKKFFDAGPADAQPEPEPEPVPEPEPPPAVGTEITALAYDGQRAVFTVGARTVTLHGPERTFRESKHGVTNTVVTDVWVRLLGAPFDGTVDLDWLDDAADANAAGAPDILAIAAQYFDGAPALLDGAGLQIAGDAGYGADGIGADWNDYLGISWTYPSGTTDEPEAEDRGNLDCSGYVRMVFGRRGGVPLGIGTPSDDRALPRTSDQQSRYSPGVVVLPRDGDTRPTNLSALRAGDLVFFDTGGDGTINHVGIYLGVDTAGHQRMMNSRDSMAGPTMRDGAGDAYGESSSRSILDGSGYYARGLRTARRL